MLHEKLTHKHTNTDPVSSLSNISLPTVEPMQKLSFGAFLISSLYFWV